MPALLYAPSLPGLPGGGAHGGWLISSSRNVLNLWECSKGGRGGMPALMLMHAQEVDLLATQLVAAASAGVMLGASLDTKPGTECVSVHSLSPEAGMLAFKYRFAPPNQRPGGGTRFMSQVCT